MPKQVIHTDAVPRPLSPISQATKAAGFVYTQGFLGRDVEGRIPPTMGEQARNALTSLKLVLEAAGGTLKDVLFVQVFVADLKEMPEFNEVFKEFFAVEPPSRIGVQAAVLSAGAKVELTAVAYTGQ
jgi:reactive intermediate/imine deaminase